MCVTADLFSSFQNGLLPKVTGKVKITAGKGYGLLGTAALAEVPSIIELASLKWI